MDEIKEKIDNVFEIYQAELEFEEVLASNRSFGSELPNSFHINYSVIYKGKWNQRGKVSECNNL